MTGVTLPYLLKIANKGPVQAMLDDPALMRGLNTYDGHITYQAVAESMNLEYVAPEICLKG